MRTKKDEEQSQTQRPEIFLAQRRCGRDANGVRRRRRCCKETRRPLVTDQQRPGVYHFTRGGDPRRRDVVKESGPRLSVLLERRCEHSHTKNNTFIATYMHHYNFVFTFPLARTSPNLSHNEQELNEGTLNKVFRAVVLYSRIY